MDNKKLTGYPSVDKPWLKYYTKAQISAPLPSGLTAYGYLKQQNQDNLSGPAITFMGTTISYQELFAMVDQVANSLLAANVKKGDIVCIDLPTLPEEVYLLYAIDEIGAVANYIIPNVPDGRLCDTLNETKCKVLFLFSAFPNNIKSILQNTSVEHVVKVGDIENADNVDEKVLTWSTFIKAGKATQPYQTVQRDTKGLFFLAKTGGSTGSPKSVMISDEGFNNIAHQFLNAPLPYERGDKWLRLWPIFSAAAAICSSHVPLCAGMNLILHPLVNVEEVDKIFADVKPNHFLMTPAILDAMMNSQKIAGQDLSYVKTGGCGGVALTEALEQKALSFFREHNISAFLGGGYGMTENSSSATYRINAETAKVGGVGIPMLTTTIGIFSPGTCDELPYNTTGEVCIKSHNAMLGYYKNKELTDAVLIDHGNGDVWIHSGDLGYVDTDGIVYIVDRIKRVIVIYPQEKIFPIDIDNVVQSIEGVDMVVTVAGPDGEHKGFFIPVCFLTIKEGYLKDEVLSDIRAICKNKLAPYSVPRHLYVCDKIPLTSMGKPDVRQLEDRANRMQE